MITLTAISLRYRQSYSSVIYVLSQDYKSQYDLAQIQCKIKLVMDGFPFGYIGVIMSFWVVSGSTLLLQSAALIVSIISLTFLHSSDHVGPTGQK